MMAGPLVLEATALPTVPHEAILVVQLVVLELKSCYHLQNWGSKQIPTDVAMWQAQFAFYINLVEA